MVTVTVEASWRLSRVEFNLPHSLPQQVMGYGEVLLKESDGAPAEILRQRSPSPTGNGVDPKTYGSMPGSMVSRTMTPEVLAEAVDVDGKPISLAQVLATMGEFMEEWRVEDAEKPAGPTPPEPGTMRTERVAPPPGSELTPVPDLGPHPPMREELPPPL